MFLDAFTASRAAAAVVTEPLTPELRAALSKSTVLDTLVCTDLEFLRDWVPPPCLRELVLAATSAHTRFERQEGQHLTVCQPHTMDGVLLASLFHDLRVLNLWGGYRLYAAVFDAWAPHIETLRLGTAPRFDETADFGYLVTVLPSMSALRRLTFGLGMRYFLARRTYVTALVDVLLHHVPRLERFAMLRGVTNLSLFVGVLLHNTRGVVPPWANSIFVPPHLVVELSTTLGAAAARELWVERRVALPSGADFFVWATRGVRIQFVSEFLVDVIGHSVVLRAAGERLCPDLAFEAYGLDDETSITCEEA